MFYVLGIDIRDTRFLYYLIGLPAQLAIADIAAHLWQGPCGNEDRQAYSSCYTADDGRQTNLYNCLYYTRSAGDNHPELIEALFHITPPLPADEQKGSFDALLSQTLGEECSMEVVQAVQTDLRERIEVHKETKSDEPLVVSGPEVRAVLETSGRPERASEP